MVKVYKIYTTQHSPEADYVYVGIRVGFTTGVVSIGAVPRRGFEVDASQ